MTIKKFQKIVWDYYERHGRNFPWRQTKNPYRILVSEIMLQQTQTSRVVEKYSVFIKKFPTVESLHNAGTSDVLRVWQGLGYNRRALSLKKSAAKAVVEYQGKIPKNAPALVSFPGVGPGTAGAILAFAYNIPAAFIETNIRRVFIYHFFSGLEKVRDNDIFPLIEKTLDRESPREWYWALMDYGAMLAKLKQNPNTRSTTYSKQPRFRGSNREARGKIIKLLASKPTGIPKTALARSVSIPPVTVTRVLSELAREGFIALKGRRVVLQ